MPGGVDESDVPNQDEDPLVGSASEQWPASDATHAHTHAADTIDPVSVDQQATVDTHSTASSTTSSPQSLASSSGSSSGPPPTPTPQALPLMPKSTADLDKTYKQVPKRPERLGLDVAINVVNSDGTINTSLLIYQPEENVRMCPLACTYVVSKTAKTLRNHLHAHHTEVLRGCTSTRLCPRTGCYGRIAPGQLVEHFLKHMKEPKNLSKYSCRVCGASLGKWNEVRNHIRRSTCADCHCNEFKRAKPVIRDVITCLVHRVETGHDAVCMMTG
jgi:hypothetical protein